MLPTLYLLMLYLLVSCLAALYYHIVSLTTKEAKIMSNKIIQLNEGVIKEELKDLVRNSGEETLNELLDQEAKALTNAEKYERTADRQGYRSGHYARNLTITSDDVKLQIPKLKGVAFETAIIERYQRRESSVEEALIEMYLAGVSVRRVEDITEALWGSRVSPSTISELNKKAYKNIEEWRNRPLESESYPYVYLDGVYLKRNWGGEYENVAILIAIGVTAEGYREVLGAAEGMKEDKESWTQFLKYLRQRGLSGGTSYAMWDGSAFSADIEDEVKLFLDYAGDVYEVDTVESTGGNYAVILQVENATLGLSGKDASVKLFLEDGTTKTFKVDEDFTDTNKSLLTAKGTWNVATFATATTGKYVGTVPVVVEYSVDKDGVVDFIDEVAYHADSPGTAAEELTEKGYYEGKAVAKDAVMFTYEGSSAADASDADKYGITTVAKATEKKFAAEYVVDKGKIIVMLTSGLGSGDEDIYGVVTGRAKTSESSSDYQVTMLIDGKEVKYDITSVEYAKFGAGTYDYATVYRLTINTKDQISGLAAATGPEIVLGSWTAASAYSNGVLTAGTDYTIDSDAVAYKWNATDGIFGPSNASKSNMVAAEVKLYDTDDDGVADLVLIRKDAVAPAVLTKIAAIDAGVSADATYTLKFSEVLDAASKSAVKAAVEAAFTTGGTSTIEFTWNADGVTLDGTFTYGDTNLVIAAVAGLTVKDLAGNSAALVTGDLQN
jgi:hypothetical protein